MKSRLIVVTGVVVAALAATSFATAALIIGTPGPDVLFGTAAADVIHGKAGDDRIHGRGGPDLLFGEADDDRMGGGQGRDSLYGNAGDDVLHARADDRARDYLNCGPGWDQAFVRGNDIAVGCEVVNVVTSGDDESV